MFLCVRHYFSLFFFSGIFAAQVEVPQKEQTVLLGQQATFMCRLSMPLQYCRVEIPGLRSFNLNKGISNDYVSGLNNYGFYQDLTVYVYRFPTTVTAWTMANADLLFEGPLTKIMENLSAH